MEKGKTKKKKTSTKKVTKKKPKISSDNNIYFDNVIQDKLHSKNKAPNNLPKMVVAFWLLLFIFTGLAFSALTSSLSTQGIATYQSHIFDYVYITSARISGSSSASNVNYAFMDHELNATVIAQTCNGYVTYELDIVNTTPHRAYITNTSVVSILDGSGNTSNKVDVEFIDVVPNQTSIAPHSTKTVHVRVKNNCNGSDDSTRIKADFQYSLLHYYDLTINATPNDASISIHTSEGNYSGTGTLTVSVMETDSVTYSVTKNNYYQETGSLTMPSQNHTINVTLDKILIVNFNANGGTVNPASKMVRNGQAMGELPTPTKANATFIGWFADNPSTYNSSVSYKTDPLYYYADTYSDLYNAFGYDDNGLYSHYLNNGYGEGRRISQYLATDIVTFNDNITLYAGWVYTWGKFNKKIVFDETLTATNATSGGIVANSYFWYHERAKLNEIADITSQELIFTQGMKSSISNTLPDHDVYVFASNSNSIKTGSWTTSGSPTTSTQYYCVITGSRVTLVAYITCDIYKVSNIRYAKGDTSYGNLYSTNSSQYPSNGESGNYWYVLS
ncbi:MAG: InlB B-repeat-containing protein [Bacilli bacterium]|nr:InlB B-repeat-containing protein [Bacilli bacterium]